MTAATAEVLVVCSLEPWDEVWRRNQHLVSRILAADEELRVLFVEPPADPLYDAVHRRAPRPGRGLRSGRDADTALAHDAAARLTLYQPTKWLPRRWDSGGDRRRARGVLRVARRLGPLYAVWINDLALVDILDLTTAPTLYDVTDDWLAARRTQTESARLARSEARLLAETATVTVCSPALAHDKGSVRPDVVVVTNGVDSAAYTGPVERPRDLGEGPVALYVGTLHADRLDVDLCARTARALRRSGGRLVLVGPDALEGRERHLLEEAGVHLLGAKPFSEIPAYTRSADVLVVPHVVDQFTDSLDPIKLYEYRAARRPVVSTRVAGFRDSRDVLVEAVSSEQFPAHVVAVTARPVPDQRQIRVPDDLPTWDRQAAVMHEVIRATVAPRDARP